MERLLRYRDLLALGICNNRPTLSNWIKHRAFPAGKLIGPNTRVWSETEVQAWLDARPTVSKSVPPTKHGRRGRPARAASASVEAEA
jgi:predicted DNA-binding transcriptional regulator AlpA